MVDTTFKPNNLILYKIRPGRVVSVSDKIEIDLGSAKTKRVRDKDITLLHEGPLNHLNELTPCQGDIDEAWGLLEGEETNLKELAELIYGQADPASVWATWQIFFDGLYFEGSLDRIVARTKQAIDDDRASREAKVKAEEEWSAFLSRLEKRQLDNGDRERLVEVEQLAIGNATVSRILKVLGHQQNRENAYKLLLDVGYWSENHNLYPAREGVPEVSAIGTVPTLIDEQRLDLTHLPAYAIDDEGNQDPDDAISLDGNRLWVHIADVAALVSPDSEMDIEARNRGSNLYLPEKIVTMLPPEVTVQLGLGLDTISPAVSVAFDILEDGSIEQVDICLSQVKVTRMSYQEADQCLNDEPFRQMQALTQQCHQRRQSNGAISLDLPEVIIKVNDGTVSVRPMERLGSRDMVASAMLLAGEAVADFCLKNEIPIPFASQATPDALPEKPLSTLSEMFAFRRKFKPSRLSVESGHHFGLGLAAYTRVTSPLRRYSDLLVHQQLRAHILGVAQITDSEIAQRMDGADQHARKIRRAERFSNLHWTLVYLKQNPDWQGDGIVVGKEGPKLVVLLPELAMEIKLRSNHALTLNEVVRLKVRQVDLPEQRAYFRILE